VRPVGSTTFGTRVEIKNLNSISALGKAIAYEFERQVRLIEAGEAVRQETRTWDGEVTLPLREKETADDYRYFPEPDLPPVAVHPAWKAQIAAELPELPEVLFDRLVEKEGLFPDEAVLIVEDLPYAVYFKALVEAGLPVKRAANWLNGPIRAHLNATATRMEDFPIPPAQIAALDTLVQEGLVSLNAAREVLFPALLEDPAADPKTLAETKGLLLVQDETLLRQWADTVLAQNPDKVQAYLAGKTGLLGFLVGQVVKLSQGKADPRRVSAYLQARLTKADKPA
jgi:aspartyl-tRNA(Asn)/glutamyl-tRNA(Gln) amidotransferase subunit B